MMSLSCYNHADRVKSVTLYHDNDASRVLAVNDYDPLGRLAKAHLPGETVAYTYNIRNALTAISSPRFAQSLYYADRIINEGELNKPCYNGNISAIVSGGTATHYTYDYANRLTEAKYIPTISVIYPAGAPDYSASYSYDLNSNITELTRYGLKTLTKYGVVDDLTMTYDGNQLTKIDDAADEVLLENSYDVKSPSVTLRPVDFPLPPFSYDSNGNTTRDQSRNLYRINYNALNLPECILVSSSSSSKLQSTIGTPSISYRYDGGGVKHEVVHSRFESIGTGLGGTLKVARHDTTRYVGSHIYENGRLDRILTPYGYLKDGIHHTYLHDYQGNVVAVVAGDSLVQQTSYYPYGLPHAKSTNATANRYKYGGKELDTFGGINLADFHARQSDLTGRFLTVDPLAEKYPHLSPYLYCAGNPIAYIDPDGMRICVTIEDMIYYYQEIENGRYGLVDENGKECEKESIFAGFVVEALGIIQEGKFGQLLIQSLIDNPQTVEIVESENGFDILTNGSFRIDWTPYIEKGGISKTKDGSYTISRPDYIGFAHEAGHAYDRLYGTWDNTTWYTKDDGKIIDRTDIFASMVENVVRYEHGIPPRISYIYTKDNGIILPHAQTSLNTLTPYILYLYYNLILK